MVAYITTKYRTIETLILHSHNPRMGETNIGFTNMLSSQQQPLMSSMEFRGYFPKLNEIHLGPFAGEQASRCPLLVKDIPKVSLYGDSTRGFVDGAIVPALIQSSNWH